MSTTEQLIYIPLEQLHESKTNPRRRFDDKTLQELADSIKQQGILQPPLVRRIANGEAPSFEIVFGSRRYRAARLAGLSEIPARVKEMTDAEVLEVQVIENLQREDVHELDEALGYQVLMEKTGLDVAAVAAKVGKSSSYVYARLKLAALGKKAQKAFYDGEVSASVALLIARIPVEKLQDEALRDINNRHNPMSYREAAAYIQRHYMLRLAEAPFPTGDAGLLNKAPACTACPKRTGNQPELFGDVKSADVCTDPECFAKKVRRYGELTLADAEACGRMVIKGAEAKKVAPHGIDRSLNGYVPVDEKQYSDPKSRTARQIAGKDAETLVLQDPSTGRVIEVISEKVVDAAINKARKDAGFGSRGDDGSRERQKKAKRERAFRTELYRRLRPKLPKPTLHTLAARIFQDLSHDQVVELCKVRGYEPKPSNLHGSKDYRAVGAGIEKMSDAELIEMINDCLYIGELMTSTWSDSRPEKLYAAAKAQGVDPQTVRKAMASAPAKQAPVKAKATPPTKQKSKTTAAPAAATKKKTTPKKKPAPAKKPAKKARATK